MQKFENLSFFQQFIKKNLHQQFLELIQNLTYEMFPPAAVIFKQGTLAQNFYIILSGKVLVLIKNKKGQNSVCSEPVLSSLRAKDPFFFN